MEGFGKLISVLDEALKKAAEECGVLLGQELATGEPRFSKVQRESFFKKRDDPCFVASVKSTGSYEGEFVMLFTLRDAIAMSGLLLGIPPGRISEKRKLSIVETDDFDAFSEILNQTIGSFNLVFQPRFDGKVHLKVSPPRKFVPDMDPFTESEPFADGEYALFQSSLSIKGQEESELYIFMPPALAELYDPPGEEEPEPEVAAGAGEELDAPAGDRAVEIAGEEPATSGDADEPSGDEAVLILDDNEQDRARIRELVAGLGFKFVEAPLDSDIRSLFTKGRICLALIGIHDGDDREMAISIKINALAQGRELPIIMCARQWTRTAVLQAVRYGARDILVKPYDSSEVTVKVGKFLKAA